MADSSSSKPSTSSAASTAPTKPADFQSQLTDEEIVQPIPDLQLAQHRFVLSQSKLSHLHDHAKQALKEGIQRDEMAPWLAQDSFLTSQLDDSNSSKLYNELKAKNEDELKKLQDKIEDAEINLGETELSDALRAKASYLAKIGEKDKAVEAYEYALSKQAGLGSKIDLRLSLIRVAFFHNDLKLASSNIESARILIDQGGDWDRRNRLKVYQAIYYLQIRDFKSACGLLLDTMPTFTAIELIPYNDFITLCIIMGVLILNRKELKSKIIDSPEVIATLSSFSLSSSSSSSASSTTTPTTTSSSSSSSTQSYLKDYTTSLYESEYAKFFKSLAEIEYNHLIPSLLLNQHARYYVREMRIKAYTQLLESYRSMTLGNLAAAFGVSEAYIENDLAKFISAGRLNCSIDKVNGVVETNRPDIKNARYEQAIKQGDVLLNSLQKLSRVIG